MKPIIGILSTYCEETQADYIKAVERAGGCPIILNKVEGLKTFEPIIQILDGIVFTGGTDINPLTYGGMPQEGLGPVDPDRDVFELVLAKWILWDTDIPILGICRGMQILNVATGGSLDQNLSSKKTAKLNHWLKDIFPKYEPSHSVKIINSSKLFTIFQKTEMLVNSLHYQSVKTIGKGFEATMLAEDGTVEAIEMKGDRFIIGVQWHPEMLADRYPEYLMLFRSFTECCKTKKSRKNMSLHYHRC